MSRRFILLHFTLWCSFSAGPTVGIYTYNSFFIIIIIIYDSNFYFYRTSIYFLEHNQKSLDLVLFLTIKAREIGRWKCVKKSSSISVIQSQLSFIYSIYTDGKKKKKSVLSEDKSRERGLFLWGGTRILPGSFANKERERETCLSLWCLYVRKERGDAISLFLKFGTVGADLGSGFFLLFLYNSSSSTPIKEEFSFLLQQPGGRLLIH